MNTKEEGAYYSQMVQRYKNEYGGKNLQDFCIKEKVSFTKMLHCLRTDSYRKPMGQSPSQPVLPQGIHPLVIDMPQNHDSHSGQDVLAPASSQPLKLEDVSLTTASHMEIRLRNCEVRTLVVLIKEMEATLC